MKHTNDLSGFEEEKERPPMNQIKVQSTSGSALSLGGILDLSEAQGVGKGLGEQFT